MNANIDKVMSGVSDNSKENRLRDESKLFKAQSSALQRSTNRRNQCLNAKIAGLACAACTCCAGLTAGVVCTILYLGGDL